MDYIEIKFLNSIQKVFYNIFAIEKLKLFLIINSWIKYYFESTGSNSYYELIISNS